MDFCDVALFKCYIRVTRFLASSVRLSNKAGSGPNGAHDPILMTDGSTGRHLEMAGNGKRSFADQVAALGRRMCIT